jgi:hypothetical protein
MPTTKTDQSIVFYPRFTAGYKKRLEIASLATFVFKLSIDARAFLEDMDGGKDQPDYLKVLKLRLLELLLEVELVFSGIEPVEDYHHAALALEYGIGQVAHIDGKSLRSIFELFDSLDGEEVSTKGVRDFWNRLIAECPGIVPNPLDPKGQRELINALRNWDKMCTLSGVNADFIKDLMREV